MRTHSIWWALASLLVASCSGSVPIDHEGHEFEDGEEVDLGTDPWRERRRMDVDQLEASLRAVTGGIGWERMNSDGTVRTRYFSAYSDTLGVPDYVNSTSEDLTVSLLFQKFLDDAARSACRRVADREAGDGPEYEGGPQGTFAPVDLTRETPPTDAEIDAALSDLLLRFHGRRVEASSPELEPWRLLSARLTEAATEAELPAKRAWEGVCVALVTHPDFYTY